MRRIYKPPKSEEEEEVLCVSAVMVDPIDA
jgi:hypothetical protein